jgi:hypothetical protein
MKIYIIVNTQTGEPLKAFENKKRAHKWALDEGFNPLYVGCFDVELDDDHVDECRCEVCRFWS